MNSRSTLSNPVFAHVSELIALKKAAETLLSPTQKKLAFKEIGNYKSPFKSKGLNFQEVRVYQPGDDLRQIDWRITAKYGEPFTKLYTDEKARSVFIISDLRTNMKFASNGDFKSVVCAKSTALLLFSAMDRLDKTHIELLLPNRIQFFSNLKKNNDIGGVLNTLSDATHPQTFPSDSISFNQALTLTTQQVTKGSVIFILSDFHDLTEDHEKTFASLAHKNTLICIHIYDFLEKQLPSGYLPVTNGTQTMIIDTTKKSIRDQFTDKFNRRQKLMVSWTKKYDLSYLPLRNDLNYIRNLRFFCEENRL